jgi:hypothetical protein
VSKRTDELGKVGDDPRGIAATLSSAQPVGVHASRPEDLTLALEAGRAGTVVLTELWYPRWRAILSGPSGEKVVPIHRVFRGGQAVEIPSAGSWALRLDYDTRPDRLALAVSGLAWLGWFVLYWRCRAGTARRSVELKSGETSG